MGCCVSTTTKTSKQENNNYPLVNSCNSSEASPQLLEEETVKEVVLSETPLSKPPTSNVLEKMSNKNLDSQVQQQEVKTESTAVIKHTGESMPLIKHHEETICGVSEHSDKCSLTESVSTATAPEKRDDYGEVTQRSPVRVPRKPGNSGKVAGVRERGVRSPARGMAPENRDQGGQVTTQKRIVEPENGFQRYSGEGSGRRSRSPVTRGEVGMRQIGRYNGPGLSETGLTGGRSPARKVDNAGEEENSNDDVLPAESETLESPVVSLECFIFL